VRLTLTLELTSGNPAKSLSPLWERRFGLRSVLLGIGIAGLATVNVLPSPAQVLDKTFYGLKASQPPQTTPHKKAVPMTPGRVMTAKAAAAVTGGEPATGEEPMGMMAQPLSATVSKTLYLPPAMYGQWSITGTLIETNASDLFSRNTNEIWILERSGDQVIITNPANGASAAINVDRVEGDRATFHRAGVAGRNKAFQEIPTITVMGDALTGQSINKILTLKNGMVDKEYYGIYQLQAQRISPGRTAFHPEERAAGPDIEIEDLHR
jgi:hypothetical protein